jgi:hypothetical protein
MLVLYIACLKKTSDKYCSILKMSDQRFARLKLDPRFRRPRKKQNKVVIDDRFKHVLTASKVDKKDKSGILFFYTQKSMFICW